MHRSECFISCSSRSTSPSMPRPSPLGKLGRIHAKNPRIEADTASVSRKDSVPARVALTARHQVLGRCNSKNDTKMMQPQQISDTMPGPFDACCTASASNGWGDKAAASMQCRGGGPSFDHRSPRQTMETLWSTLAAANLRECAQLRTTNTKPRTHESKRGNAKDHQ